MDLEELDESESSRPSKKPRQSKPKVKTGCLGYCNRVALIKPCGMHWRDLAPINVNPLTTMKREKTSAKNKTKARGN